MSCSTSLSLNARVCVTMRNFYAKVSQCTRKNVKQDSPFDAPVSPEAAVKSLERTHVGVLHSNDLLREAQAARQIVVLVYRAVILNLIAEADRRQYRERDDGVQLARRHSHFRARHTSHHLVDTSFRSIDTPTLATDSGLAVRDRPIIDVRKCIGDARRRARNVRNSRSCSRLTGDSRTTPRRRIRRAPRYARAIRAPSRHGGSRRARDNTTYRR